jgi:hypothetical protein
MMWYYMSVVQGYPGLHSFRWLSAKMEVPDRDSSWLDLEYDKGKETTCHSVPSKQLDIPESSLHELTYCSRVEFYYILKCF